MDLKRLYISLIIIAFASCGAVNAQEVKDSVKIHFRQGRTELDASIRDNREALNRIADSLANNHIVDSIFQLRKVVVTGGASPEGSVARNEWLSRQRADVLFKYFSRYAQLPDSLLVFHFIGRDWEGLLQGVRQDRNVPNRDETITFLEDVVEKCRNGENEADGHAKRFEQLCGGAPYRYTYQKLFPDLRASMVELTYEKTWNPVKIMKVAHVEIKLPEIPLPELKPLPIVPIEIPQPVEERKPFYMAVKTNLLEDLVMVPNLGLEFYVGRSWSIGGNWKYAWWHNDRKHNYWRVYGGDLYVRRYFGRKAAEKPLQGHHIGVYGQVATYDFELGGMGYMGGVPGGNIFDKFSYGGGIEYGYSLPIARRLNLDFSIGLGYFGGEYREYVPMDECYVWQATKYRHYWGPTKAEISLVWLLGRDNFNVRKGGKR